MLCKCQYTISARQVRARVTMHSAALGAIAGSSVQVPSKDIMRASLVARIFVASSESEDIVMVSQAKEQISPTAECC